MGNHKSSQDIEAKEKIVKEYYEELFSIQAGEHSKIKQIKGYRFADEIKAKIMASWRSVVDNVPEDLEYEFNRELHEAYRFLIFLVHF